MQRGVRFRCYPTTGQAHIPAREIGSPRFISDAKVSEDRHSRRFARKSPRHTGQGIPIDPRYSQFRTDPAPWLAEGPSQVPRHGAVRGKRAMSRYFANPSGHPALRKRRGRQSVWPTSELFAFTPIPDTVSRLGVTIEQYRVCEGGAGGLRGARLHAPRFTPSVNGWPGRSFLARMSRWRPDVRRESS